MLPAIRVPNVKSMSLQGNRCDYSPILMIIYHVNKIKVCNNDLIQISSIGNSLYNLFCLEPHFLGMTFRAFWQDVFYSAILSHLFDEWSCCSVVCCLHFKFQEGPVVVARPDHWTASILVAQTYKTYKHCCLAIFCSTKCNEHQTFTWIWTLWKFRFIFMCVMICEFVWV